MSDTQDPFATHLQRAQDLFQAGEVIAAGQIWQAILRKNPTHAGARACLVHVKNWLDERQKAGDPVVLAAQNQGLVDRDAIPSPAPAEAPPLPLLEAEAPPPKKPAEDEDDEDIDIDLLIRQGCTLFEMDQIEDALVKWTKVLKVEPNHHLALEYVASARQELARQAAKPVRSVTALAEPALPSAAVPELASEDTGVGIFESRLLSLLQEGLRLYHNGNTDGAMAHWREMLALDPDNEDARAYLSLAQKSTSATAFMDVGIGGTGSPTIDATRKILNAEALEQKCHQGERLMRLNELEQAELAFKVVLAQAPRHERASRGLEQVKALLTERPPGSEPEAGSAWENAAVMPPAAVTAPGKPARRGLSLPIAISDMTRNYPWMKSKGVLGGVAGVLLVLIVGGFVFHQRRIDAKLASDRASFSSAALARVSRGNEAPDLSEKPPGIRTEAELAIREDPVRAYHRAKEFLRLNPGDMSASQLLDRAREALTLNEDNPRTATLADFQKHLSQGDLKSAEADIDALLRSKPDDSDLMQRASRLYLVLAQLQASRERWDEAKDALLKGRALNPADRSWQGRLKLLEKIPNQPKAERPGWIAFLG